MHFGRVLTAMVTPMAEDLSVDYERAGGLAQELVESGSDGLVVLGTTGEAPTLTREERRRLVEVVVEAVGDRARVIAGSGNYSTAESIELTREAERAGAHGVMLVTPYYNRPSQEGLYEHFRRVAGATGLPVLLYNVPSRTGVNLLPATVRRLAEIPNIVALKEASGNLSQVSEVVASVPAGFAVYSGNDADTLPILAVGGAGVVSVASHVVGRQVQAMIEHFFRGDVAGARKIHLELFPLFTALFVTTNPVPVKAALGLLGRGVGGVRPPLVPCDTAQLAVIRRALEGLGLLEPRSTP